MPVSKYFLFCALVFVAGQLHSYDRAFSKVFPSVYEKNHASDGDVWDEARALISGKRGSFRELEERGVSGEVLDAMAYQWARSHKNFRMLCVWPHVPYSEEATVLNIIEKKARCFYHKKITLRGKSPLQLMYIIPDKRVRYREVYHKYFFSDRAEHKMMCYLILVKEDQDAIWIKGRVRNFYQLGHRAIHASDTHEQSMDLAQIFLCDRALERFNNQYSDEPTQYSQ